MHLDATKTRQMLEASFHMQRSTYDVPSIMNLGVRIASPLYPVPCSCSAPPTPLPPVMAWVPA